MKRNILNIKEVDEFLGYFIKDYPAYETYIRRNVRNYLLRRGLARRNIFFRWKSKKTAEEKKYLENGGPFYFVVLNESTRTKVIKALDYLKGQGYSPSTTLEFEAALRFHEEMVKSLNSSKEDNSKDTACEEVVKTFEDGYVFVRLLNKKAFDTEGKVMEHCLGSYDPRVSKIYSLGILKNSP